MIWFHKHLWLEWRRPDCGLEHWKHPTVMGPPPEMALLDENPGDCTALIAETHTLMRRSEELQRNAARLVADLTQTVADMKRERADHLRRLTTQS